MQSPMLHEEKTDPAVDIEEIETNEEERPRSWCVKYGNIRVLCGDRERMFPYQCVIGPNYICMCMTYCLVSIPTILFLVYIGWKVHWAVEACAIATVILTLVLFSVIACSDPGVVYESYVPENDHEGVVTCAQCQVRRPYQATHCYECHVCVHDLDHHCPWTGKCIGKKTIKYFYAFLWSLTIHFLLVLGGSAYYFFNRTSDFHLIQ